MLSACKYMASDILANAHLWLYCMYAVYPYVRDANDLFYQNKLFALFLKFFDPLRNGAASTCYTVFL